VLTIVTVSHAHQREGCKVLITGEHGGRAALRHTAA
jgi:hypothetical protein